MGANRSCWHDGPPDYSDIQALHLGPHGRTLTILVGRQYLDGWDLHHGLFLGRWRLEHDDHLAMCHNGADLLLARQGNEGPILESTTLPSSLVVDDIMSDYRSSS